MDKNNKDFLLSELIRFYNENGKVPTFNDLTRNKNFPSVNRYVKHFGKFSNALKEVGLMNEQGINIIDQIKFNRIKNDYINGMDVKEIAVKYGYPHSTAIFPVLKKIGVELKTNRWTQEKIKLLRENYPTEEWDVLLEILHPFNKEDITTKAYKLKIKRLINAEYSEEEIEILKDKYHLLPTKELMKLLPYRSEFSIATKANKLGLVSREKWTQEDLNKLKQLYPTTSNTELAKIFNRSEISIQCTGNENGLYKAKGFRREFTKEELKERLLDFANLLGRTPTVDEVTRNQDMPGFLTYNRYFGSYRDACLYAGLDPNMNLFGETTHVYYSSNGDLCLSKSELIITEILIDNNIQYEKEYLYCDLISDVCGLKRMDWLVNENIVVEYFGLPEKEYYQERMIEKINLCNKNNVKLIQLFRNDFFRNYKGIIEKFNQYGIALNINNEILKSVG
jgi:hypothetical protein